MRNSLSTTCDHAREPRTSKNTDCKVDGAHARRRWRGAMWVLSGTLTCAVPCCPGGGGGLQVRRHVWLRGEENKQSAAGTQTVHKWRRFSRSLSDFFFFCLWSAAVNFWPKGSGSCLSPAGYVCVYVLPGQMVFVWAASDKACINLVKIALAGGAAGGSSWCLPAKRLTYVPGLKETIVFRWRVGGAAACFFSLFLFLPPSLNTLYILKESSGSLASGATAYWSDIKRWTFESATDSSRAQVVVWKSSRAGRQLLSATSLRAWIMLQKMCKSFHHFPPWFDKLN